ncbi:hypothetical protein [Botrimarina hoheduenensis]|uniref:Uncharacterized protein n=1 Tax=Botrimarina hoheduenensis TaxID=2528000 RepID=A0A5C5W8S3_9BACT|nr:hypothetical protein [Botrimarina hoheduenensis]TWT46663.1 hypothetical protein Pla111_17640 [Botrimarina hoheduenensis]
MSNPAASSPHASKALSGKLLVWMLLGAMLIVTAILIGGVGFALYGPDETPVISPQTTVLTEPLRADGWPDYEEAIRRRWARGATPANNGAIPFWRAMITSDLGELDDPAEQDLIARELGIKTLSLGDGFVGGPDALERRLAEELQQAHPRAVIATENLLTFFHRKPWTKQDSPLLASWVAANAAAYQLLHEAAAASHFYPSSPTLLDDQRDRLQDIALPALQHSRTAVHYLCLRAMLAVGEGRPDEAADDLIAAYRLADHISAGPFPIHLLLGEYHNLVVDRALAHLCVSREVSLETIAKLLRYIESRPMPRDPLDVELEIERIAPASYAAQLATKRARIDDGPTNPPLRARRIDWNIALKELAPLADLADRAIAAPDLPTRDGLISKLRGAHRQLSANSNQPFGWRQIVSTRDRSRRQAWLISGDSFSFFLHRNREMRFSIMTQQRALARELLSLTAQRIRDGDYPDEYKAEGINYRRTNEGVLLWSNGPNGRDDRGLRSFAVARPQDSLLLPLYEGRLIPLAQESYDSEKPVALDPAQQALLDAIPPDADDAAIRLPPPQEPWPWEEAEPNE